MWHSIGNGNSVLFGGDRACEVFELCESVVGHVTVMVAGGSSTLHWAGQDGQTGVVKALLAAGACLHASSSAPPAIAWGVSVAIKVSCCFMFDIVLDSNCCLLFAASSHSSSSRRSLAWQQTWCRKPSLSHNTSVLCNEKPTSLYHLHDHRSLPS